MREIRFRAWDKVKSDMSYQNPFWSGSNGFIHIVDIYTGYDNWEETKHYEIMQFTGLLDKNNVPIYEGDIVKGEAKDPFVIVPMLGGLSIHNINNLGQEHNELISMPTNDAQTASWLEESIVIGNIYENPELL